MMTVEGNAKYLSLGNIVRFQNRWSGDEMPFLNQQFLTTGRVENQEQHRVTKQQRHPLCRTLESNNRLRRSLAMMSRSKSAD